MKSNYLKLNTSKTEVMIFAKNTSLLDFTWWSAKLGFTPTINPRNLGIVIDSKLDMTAQVNAVSATHQKTANHSELGSQNHS